MRAEYLIAGATASGIDYRNVGRSTRPYDEKRAYFAGIPRDAWVCLRVMEDDENRAFWREFYLFVLLEVGKRIERGISWPRVEERLAQAGRWQEYRRANRKLIERLTCLAVMEYKYAEHFRHGDPSDKRAAFIGLKRRQWFAGGYSQAYKHICAITEEWMNQARRIAWRNQLDVVLKPAA